MRFNVKNNFIVALIFFGYFEVC